MYNLCSQHLQSLDFVQQKLFVLQPLIDMFQMRHPALQADLDLPWSPHSSNLNSPDFYLWGYFKDRVYEPNLQTIPYKGSHQSRERRARHVVYICSLRLFCTEQNRMLNVSINY